uniref:General transcription factor IIH subunit 3 n=1 Tax=Steinernema glaseri TaxID=37863 RepID=A0A1I8A0H1_9BILA
MVVEELPQVGNDAAELDLAALEVSIANDVALLLDLLLDVAQEKVNVHLDQHVKQEFRHPSAPSLDRVPTAVVLLRMYRACYSRSQMSDLLCVVFDCNALSLGRVLDRTTENDEDAEIAQTSLISDVLALCTSHLSVSIGNRLLFLLAAAPGDRDPKQSPVVFDSSVDLFCDLQEKVWAAISSALEHSACNGNPTSSVSTSYAPAVSIAACQIARYKRENTCQSGRILLVNSSESYGVEMGKLMNLFFAIQKLDILIDVVSLIPGPPTLQQACDITGGNYVFIDEIGTILVDLMMYMFPDADQRSNFNKPELQEVDYSAVCHCHGENVQIGWVCTCCLAVQCQFTPICSVCKSVYKLKVAPPRKLVRPKKRKALDPIGA